MLFGLHSLWSDKPIYRDEVTLKCNNCGEEIVFFPNTIMTSPRCECGNNDSGNCTRDWKDNKFGNFTLVQRRNVSSSIETPFGKKYI